uniref:KLRG1 protein n=1 Tax=Nothoprocta perdicaria TaxID=30464 RepID=A0A8C6ZGW8_NOTPE
MQLQPHAKRQQKPHLSKCCCCLTASEHPSLGARMGPRARLPKVTQSPPVPAIDPKSRAHEEPGCGQCQFCPAGWIWDAGHCYYFSSAKKTWEQSKEDCCSREAHLATVRTNSTLVSAPC